MTANPLESTVETHIDSTSRLVRQVDLAFSLLIVVSLLLGGLFLAVIADHWILKEGLSIPLRLGIFAVLVAFAGLYVYWKIVPLFRYSVNPVYTADLIEKDVSTFKNSLINWILLRQEREERITDGLTPARSLGDERMYDGIVKTAAVNVQTVPARHAVDVRKLMIVGATFTILLLGFAIYGAFSPKNPLTSLARVLFPFSGIDRPQAAQFRNVTPGDAVVLQGETIIISAEVISQSAEPVYLVFSTDDGQAVNQRIPMTLPEGKIAFEASFPPGKQGNERGFNSSVDYRIAQGESKSKQYRLDVQPAASVEVVSLQYDFPEYTGLPREIVEHGGDIRALEGTSVTVTVRSTLPLEKIDLVFDDNPINNVLMRIDDAQKTEAKGAFVLKTPFPHKTYSFRATDKNGNVSRRSGIYRIEVIPDRPPKVQWADTAKHLLEPEIHLPLNETLQCPIQAEDPDFALRYLRFKTESPGKRIPDVSLLDSPTTGPTKHRGLIKQTVDFSPEGRRLAVGDTAEIWVEAADTKLPTANVDSTRRIKIKVIDPKAEDNGEQEQDEDGEKQPQEDGKQDESQENGANDTGEKDPDKEGTEGEQGEQGGGENGGEQDSDEQEEQNGGEGQQDPDEQEQEGQDQNQNGTSGEDDPSDDQQENGNQGGNAGDEPGDGDEQGTGNQPGDGQGDEGGNAPENQPANEAQKGDGAGGDKTGNESEQDSSVDPETQDGDAMERVVEQMKEEGLFPGANPFLRNDNQNMKNNAFDPNSKNRSNQGNDPNSPKESNSQPEGNPQNQQQKPDKPKEGEAQQCPQCGGKMENGQCSQCGGTNSGRAGDMDSDSGNQEGTSQEGEGTQGSQGEQGDGGKQQGQGESGDSGEQQGNNSQDSNSGNSSETSSEMGGMNGGSRAGMDTKPDDPNLKYANEVTNMVLDYLENQLKDKPNDELLNKLDWTEEQLRQFYDKWKKMSENSKQPQVNEDEKNPWEEALKSIGLLRPKQNRPALQGSQTGRRDNQNVREAQRPPVPPAIRDQFRNYNNNVGK
jgi:hypothetical protein